ncbi:MAG: hypothetical protein ACRD9W_23490, partial [Terriglobia bacterium]
MRMRAVERSALIGSVLAALTVVGPTHAAAQSRVEFTLPFGKYDVGFRDVHLFDSSRAVLGTDSLGERLSWRPRPLQVSIWYPALTAAGATPMRYREYVWLFATPLSFAGTDERGHTGAERAFLDWLVDFTDKPPGWRPGRLAELEAARRREFDVPTHAFRNAAQASGNFPIIIYAPGMGGPSFENDILME